MVLKTPTVAEQSLRAGGSGKPQSQGGENITSTDKERPGLLWGWRVAEIP